MSFTIESLEKALQEWRASGPEVVFSAGSGDWYWLVPASVEEPMRYFLREPKPAPRRPGKARHAPKRRRG